MAVTVLEAKESHLNLLTPLLDAYRIFYNQASDVAAAQLFLKERFKKKESIIFLAFYDGKAAGFTQLYRSFSTVSLKPILILNDLYVAPDFRKKGVGESLLRRAQVYCSSSNCKGLALETAVENPARSLYERLGWTKDVQCFHYFWQAD
jgi:GNAT superfamily N-acetyltransferase